MLSSTLLWVGLGLFLLIVVALYNTPRAKAARARDAEEDRKRQEERSREMREVAEEKARQLENLRKQRFVVYIREKDGRKSSFEAVLISTLLGAGTPIKPLEEKVGHAIASGNMESLKNGVFAVIGTAWSSTKIEYCGEELGHRNVERTYCDYRLLMKDDNGARIMAAGSEQKRSSDENDLARSIVNHLAWGASKIEVQATQ